MTTPVRVAVTGAAGSIGYSLLFRIASGEMLGPDQPVILQLIEIPQAVEAVEGVVMELNDCAFDLLEDVISSPTIPRKASMAPMSASSWAGKPRGPGMVRADLIKANGPIFTEHGRGDQRLGRRRHPRGGGGQPMQHQRADHDAQRARTCPTSASPR